MITLYYAPDNASLIVRILLEELQLPYEAVLVDRSTTGQQSAEYLRLNPNGLIPVCIIADRPVFETGAILLSLADTHQQFTVPLLSDQRPQFLKWLFYLSNSLHTDLRMRFYPDKYAGPRDECITEFGQVTFDRLLQRIALFNNEYIRSGNTYLFDENPTIVDFYLAVCMRWVQIYPKSENGRVDIANFPAILKLLGTLEKREMVIRACEQEGITGEFFSRPDYANPSEGVAL